MASRKDKLCKLLYYLETTHLTDEVLYQRKSTTNSFQTKTQPKKKG